MSTGTASEYAVCIAILAGGRSRRMGRDKALLPWRGHLMIDEMISIAARVPEAGETLIVGDRPEYHGRGARVVEDRYPGAGPLGGIVTALAAMETDRAIVLAVDMPLVSPGLLSAMARHPAGPDALVPEVIDRRTGTMRLQVLHAIYHRRCIEPGRRCLCHNERRVMALLDAVEVERLDADWIRRFDPELRSFENVNDPGEYARVKSYRADEWRGKR